MPLKIACPACAAVIKSQDNIVGRKIKCPGCSFDFTVSPAHLVDTARVNSPSSRPAAADVIEAPPRPAPSRPAQVYDPPPNLPATRPAPTMPCPFCSEEILMTAKKCKHCGEFLDGRNHQPAPAPVVVVQQQPAYVEPVRERPGRNGFDFEDDEPRQSVQTTVEVHNTYVAPRAPFPHGMHLMLTLFTCGGWLPFWLLHWMFSGFR